MKLNIKFGFANLILIISLFCVGLFHEYFSCAASIVMISWLIYKAVKEKKSHFYFNAVSLSVLLIAAFYLLSVFWAVDSGVAVMGFIRFLPVLLYLIVLMQEEECDYIINTIPYAAGVMAVASVIGMQIPVLHNFFSVAERLAGFFEYPNTFALFLLVAELILISKQKPLILDYILIAVLLFSVVYTGSRTVLVLTAVSNIVMIFAVKTKKVKIILLSVMALMACVIGIYLLLFDNSGVLSRFKSFSFGESTFVGRWLYFKDALPLLIKHPFGLGYMGYYYIEQSIQTGVYSVMYIHNDFLQLALDVGIIPACVFAFAIIKSIFTGKKPFYIRVILSVMALHAFFDFDLQFAAVFMMLLLFTDYKGGKEFIVSKPDGICFVGVTSAIVCLYFGVATLLMYSGKVKAANSLYPFDTRAETVLIANEQDMQKAEEKADKIIKQNKYVNLAYDIKARNAYSSGDFKSLIELKGIIFKNAPFAYEEYEEYCYMMIIGINLYRQAGDKSSADVCLKELISAADMVHSSRDRLSSLGKKIDDQPKTKLPDDIEDYIKSEIKQK